MRLILDNLDLGVALVVQYTVDVNLQGLERLGTVSSLHLLATY